MSSQNPSHASAPGATRSCLEVHASGVIGTLRLPQLTVVGTHPGPVSAVVAGQHGRETAGTLAAALAFRELDPQLVRGTIHFFPTINPLALRIRQQDYPVESGRFRKLDIRAETNLDRLWGAEQAVDPLLPAITSQLWNQCLVECDQLLDLHGWSEFFCPMAWAHERDAELLRGTGFPYLTLRRDNPQLSLHTLREMAWSVTKPIVVVELPGQNVVRPGAIELGRQTVRGFLNAAGHLQSPTRTNRSPIELNEGGAQWSGTAPVTGLWNPLPAVGDVVREGDVLGELLCLETFEVLAELRAKQSGLLLFNGPALWGEDHREHQVIFAGQKLARVQEINISNF